MPAISSWCQRPVSHIVGGGEEPAACFTRIRLQTPNGYGITQRQDHPRLAGVQYYPCRSRGTRKRAVSSITCKLSLLSGNVEVNPGPTLRGLQWNSVGLTQAKRVALRKLLQEENVTLCLLSETKMSDREKINLMASGNVAVFYEQYILMITEYQDPPKNSPANNEGHNLTIPLLATSYHRRGKWEKAKCVGGNWIFLHFGSACALVSKGDGSHQYTCGKIVL